MFTVIRMYWLVSFHTQLEGGREGGRDGGRDGGREGWRDGGREGRDGGREGGREDTKQQGRLNPRTFNAVIISGSLSEENQNMRSPTCSEGSAEEIVFS